MMILKTEHPSQLLYILTRMFGVRLKERLMGLTKLFTKSGMVMEMC